MRTPSGTWKSFWNRNWYFKNSASSTYCPSSNVSPKYETQNYYKYNLFLSVKFLPKTKITSGRWRVIVVWNDRCICHSRHSLSAQCPRYGPSIWMSARIMERTTDSPAFGTRLGHLHCRRKFFKNKQCYFLYEFRQKLFHSNYLRYLYIVYKKLVDKQ